MTKRILHFALFFMTLTLGFGQTTEVIADWDGTDLAMTNSFGNGHFADSLFAIVANPNATGINTSANVQNWQKADNAQTWGGFFYDPATTIDLTGGTAQICINAMSDHDFIMRLKIEGSGDDGPSASFDMTYSGAGEWQQLCYDLFGTDTGGETAAGAGHTYSRLTLFPDFGTVPATDASYFLDDITKTTGGPVAPAPEVIADWDGTDLAMGNSFGNGHFSDSLFAIVANPNATGINTSANVQNWQKADNAQTWGGFFYDPPQAISATGAFAEVCLNAMSDHDFVLRFKVEGSTDGGPSTSFDMTYTGAGEWQQLCFDLLGTDVNGTSGTTAGYTYARFTMFPDFGTVPAADASYFFDDIYKITGGGGIIIPGEIISNYDDITVDMTGSFGNGHYGGDLFGVVANPSPDGGNPSDLVQEWCKANDAQVWGGFIMNLGLDTLDFTGTDATICFSVYSEIAAPMRLKLEGSPTGPDVRLDLDYTTPGAWQKLCYDFSVPDVDGNEALGNMYFDIVFFPAFGTVPAADQCFYIDDIYKVTNGTGMISVFISDVIKDSPDHNTLEELLNATDLWGAVDASNVTVFAPDDAAFAALDAGELDALMNNTDNAAFNMLLYHVTRDSLPTDELTMDRSFIMRNGTDAVVTTANSAVSSANITSASVDNSNGILHFVDAVLEYTEEPDFYLHDDFETPDFQNWFGFNWGSADANIWIEANPDPSGINTSTTVLHTRKYPDGMGAASFQGIVVEENVRPMNFIGNMTDVCVDFYAPAVGSTLRWKLERGSTTDLQLRYLVESTVANQWETLCADFTEPSVQDGMEPAGGEIFTRMAIFFDFVSGQFPDAETDYYIDNFIIKNSMAVGTEDIAELENFSMFPNPTNDRLTIKTDSPVEYAIVHDATGVRMMVIPQPLNQQINVSKLPAGMYYIQLLNKDQAQIGIAKFVKN